MCFLLCGSGHGQVAEKQREERGKPKPKANGAASVYLSNNTLAILIIKTTNKWKQDNSAYSWIKIKGALLKTGSLIHY